MSFGGEWTVAKLELLEKYFNAYNIALKKQWYTRVYIDAFAGCGKININGRLVDGSARRSLSCSNKFDKYLFIDKDRNNCKQLERMIEVDFPSMASSVEIINGDSNELIKRLGMQGFTKERHRGVIFLDPFALELQWASLEAIAEMELFDVWYLFPIMSMLRCLPNTVEGKEVQEKIRRLLGAEDLFSELYHKSETLEIFNTYERDRLPQIIDYIVKRLNSLFGKNGVAQEPLLLRDRDNRPKFLLCFAVSNPSTAARNLALTIANDLLRQ